MSSTHTEFTHQPHPQSPYHGERVSVHSGYITPSALALPVFIPPRDYDDDDDQMSLSPVATPSLSARPPSSHSYYNRTFDYSEGYSSPDHSFVNIGYQSTASSSDVGIPVGSNFQPIARYSPQSTSTPVVPKVGSSHTIVYNLLV